MSCFIFVTIMAVFNQFTCSRCLLAGFLDNPFTHQKTMEDSKRNAPPPAYNVHREGLIADANAEIAAGTDTAYYFALAMLSFAGILAFYTLSFLRSNYEKAYFWTYLLVLFFSGFVVVVSSKTVRDAFLVRVLARFFTGEGARARNLLDALIPVSGAFQSIVKATQIALVCILCFMCYDLSSVIKDSLLLGCTTVVWLLSIFMFSLIVRNRDDVKVTRTLA